MTLMKFIVAHIVELYTMLYTMLQNTILIWNIFVQCLSNCTFILVKEENDFIIFKYSR